MVDRDDFRTPEIEQQIIAAEYSADELAQAYRASFGGEQTFTTPEAERLAFANVFAAAEKYRISQNHDIFFDNTHFFAGQAAATDLFSVLQRHSRGDGDFDFTLDMVTECGSVLAQARETGEDPEVGVEELTASITELGLQTLNQLWTEARFVAEAPMDMPLRYQVYSALNTQQEVVPAFGGYVMIRNPENSQRLILRLAQVNAINGEIEFSINAHLNYQTNATSYREIRLASDETGARPSIAQGYVWNKTGDQCLAYFEPRKRHLEQVNAELKAASAHAVDWQDQYCEQTGISRFNKV